MRLTEEWRWHLIAASVAVVLAVGGAHVADRVSKPLACREASGFARVSDPAVVDGDLAAAVLLKQAESLLEVTKQDVRASFAPAVVPGYQKLRAGEAGTWEVAVVQLGGTTRSLDVDYGDGSPHTRMKVPAGSGACRFTLTRTYPHPAGQRELRFSLSKTGSRSTFPRSGEGDASVTAFVDVLEGS